MVEGLVAEVAALRQAVERGQGVESDQAIVVAIASVSLDRVFTSADVMCHSRLPEATELRTALRSLTTRRLGKLLERVEGDPLGGFIVERVSNKGNSGVIWQIVTVPR